MKLDFINDLETLNKYSYAKADLNKKTAEAMQDKEEEIGNKSGNQDIPIPPDKKKFLSGEEDTKDTSL